MKTGQSTDEYRMNVFRFDLALGSAPPARRAVASNGDRRIAAETRLAFFPLQFCFTLSQYLQICFRCKCLGKYKP